MTLRNTVLAAGLLAAAAVVLGQPGTAHARPRGGGGTWFRYAVKFTCGLNPDETPRVVPGDYATAVSVLNAGDVDVLISKHVALSFPPVEQLPGEVSDPIVETVPATGYVQGFLVIEASAELDVSAVYTSKGATGDVSVDVEAIAGRAVAGDDSTKVTICHQPPGNRGNAQTLSVGASAVPAHLGHGDSLGACAP